MFKILFVFVFCFVSVAFGQEFTMMSWNISNLGKSKTVSDLDRAADIMQKADIVCVQEVVSGYGGAQAVGKLLDRLNRGGSSWDYSLSDATDSSGNRSERYVYFWKKSKFKIKRRFELEGIYKDFIEREPYIGSFTFEGKEFKIFNFHALPKKHNPESEIKYFKNYSRLYGNSLFFVGDFNVVEKNSVFTPILKQGFRHILPGQKTTLKQECKAANCLANGYDYIWYASDIFELVKAEALFFYEDYSSLKLARKLSDHIPIMATFRFKD